MPENAGAGSRREAVDTRRLSAVPDAAVVGEGGSGGTLRTPRPERPQGLINLAGFSETLRRVLEHRKQVQDEKDDLKGKASAVSWRKVIDQGLPKGESLSFRRAFEKQAAVFGFQQADQRAAKAVLDFSDDIDKGRTLPTDVEERLGAIYDAAFSEVQEEGKNVFGVTDLQKAIINENRAAKRSAFILKNAAGLRAKTEEVGTRNRIQNLTTDFASGFVSTFSASAKNNTPAIPTPDQLKAWQATATDLQNEHGTADGAALMARALAGGIRILRGQRDDDGEPTFDDDDILTYLIKVEDSITVFTPNGKGVGRDARVPLSKHGDAALVLDKVESELSSRRGTGSQGGPTKAQRRAAKMYHSEEFLSVREAYFQKFLSDDTSSSVDPKAEAEALLASQGLKKGSGLFVALREMMTTGLTARAQQKVQLSGLRRNRATTVGVDDILTARKEDLIALRTTSMAAGADPKAIDAAVAQRLKDLTEFEGAHPYTRTLSSLADLSSTISYAKGFSDAAAEAKKDFILVRSTLNEVARDLLDANPGTPASVALLNMKKDPRIVALRKTLTDKRDALRDARENARLSMRSAAATGDLNTLFGLKEKADTGLLSRGELEASIQQANRINATDSYNTGQIKSLRTLALNGVKTGFIQAGTDTRPGFVRLVLAGISPEDRSALGLPSTSGQPIRIDRAITMWRALYERNLQREIAGAKADPTLLTLSAKQRHVEDRMAKLSPALVTALFGDAVDSSKLREVISQGPMTDEAIDDLNSSFAGIMSELLINQDPDTAAGQTILDKYRSDDKRTGFSTFRKVLSGLSRGLGIMDQLGRSGTSDTAGWSYMPAQSTLKTVASNVTNAPVRDFRRTFGAGPGRVSESGPGRTFSSLVPEVTMPNGQKQRISISPDFVNTGLDPVQAIQAIYKFGTPETLRQYARNSLAQTLYAASQDPTLAKEISPSLVRGLGVPIESLKAGGRVTLLGAMGGQPLPDAEVDSQQFTIQKKMDAIARKLGITIDTSIARERGDPLRIGTYKLSPVAATNPEIRKLQAEYHVLELRRESLSIPIESILGDQKTRIREASFLRVGFPGRAAPSSVRARYSDQVTKFLGLDKAVETAAQNQFWTAQDTLYNAFHGKR